MMKIYCFSFNIQVDGIFETQQFVNLSWKDPRIQFHNLKNQEYQNSLLESEKQMIWIPKVTFLNTAKQVQSNYDIESFLNLIVRTKVRETIYP